MFTFTSLFKVVSMGLRKNNFNQKREGCSKNSDLEKQSFPLNGNSKNPKLFVKGNLIKLGENCVFEYENVHKTCIFCYPLISIVNSLSL